MEKIKEIAEGYGCVLVYLFGSQAQKGMAYLNGGDVVYDNLSDLDIAVAFETAPDDIDTYECLYKEFSELFEPFDIDLVFIHEVDTVFCYEIIKGIRIYEKSEEAADRFEEDALKRAADLYFKKKVFDKEVMEAIEDGYFQFEYNPNS
ncbi:MAG: nucleotidyltransferase domain-containing protein [Deltaproteobacteria bacterium]|nr:nucleotidyltransferase domain-containing protein [Deltaproteobacteria bacterium]